MRVAVRKGTAPPVGSFVQLKARLTPPLAPLRPGGYDFARDLYFQQLGASGFVLGRITTVAPPAEPDAGLRWRTLIESMRDAIDMRIRSVVGGDEGKIASALITGKRNAISDPVNNAMYVSSLAHVLAISGYHMAIVAGVMFFVVRALLALFPTLASRAPIKKYAAFAALGAAAFYLLLSGAQVATQRSFIMIAIVLVGVMLDRSALTLRTITVAAFVVLLIAPQSLVHPSFQMSFAATLALIATYQRSLVWRASADSSATARAALWGAREVLSLILASAVAGLATMPYAAFHFHRLAPYGVLANLLAMPVVSTWIMPAGLGAILTMPFGFDAPLWRLMGHGIDWMITVALWVSSLPGAVGRIGAFGTGPLLLGTAGLIVICLLRTPLRLLGLGLAAVAAAWAILTPQPAILVAADGRALAVRGADGRLSIAQRGNDRFAVGDWLAADADGRSANDKSLAAGVRCDEMGCIARLPDGRPIALSLTLEAFAEDCRSAAVVASPRDAPPGCASLAIDRQTWLRSGAVAIFADGDGFRVQPTHPPGYDRPWAPTYHLPATTTRAIAPAARSRPEAIPRSDDLDVGD